MIMENGSVKAVISSDGTLQLGIFALLQQEEKEQEKYKQAAEEILWKHRYKVLFAECTREQACSAGFNEIKNS